MEESGPLKASVFSVGNIVPSQGFFRYACTCSGSWQKVVNRFEQREIFTEFRCQIFGKQTWKIDTVVYKKDITAFKPVLLFLWLVTIMDFLECFPSHFENRLVGERGLGEQEQAAIVQNFFPKRSHFFRAGLIKAATITKQ